jgi:hypothetical protein
MRSGVVVEVQSCERESVWFVGRGSENVSLRS